MKKFIVIGTNILPTYRGMFEYFRDRTYMYGSTGKELHIYNIDKTRHAGCAWFTNIKLPFVYKKLELHTMEENTKKKLPINCYKEYDNYDAIEVSKCDLIPTDYNGWMGLPYSILEKEDIKNFEIKTDTAGLSKKLKINGRQLFDRVILRWKKAREEKYHLTWEED